MLEINWKNAHSIGDYRGPVGREFDRGSPLHLLRNMAVEQYAFPGCYEMVLITTDGGVICGDCARTEYEALYRSTKNGDRDGWTVAGIDATCNWDEGIYCDHCGREIKSAYAE